MYQVLEQRIKALRGVKDKTVFTQNLIGLEKETLRVNPEGGIAQTPHPAALGSALTHPYITTDYSEALLEIVTPPAADMQAVLQSLHDSQLFIYNNLDNEILWATSMPCVVAGETSIPIARYGSSNAGMMKTVYRRGLGHRYGRVMQVIAGVHYNYSFAESFWPVYQTIINQTGDINNFISESYFSLLRNLQRFGWVIPYLFGASPAVCKSFLQGQQTTLDSFNENTFYEPYATSLRMGDIGYQNNKEAETGITANYDSLSSYIESLQHAIETSYPGYEKFGLEVDGVYQQLSTNILQIENEYYSTVRPKQIVEKYEMPIEALRHRGVRYVELRSLDVNAYHPLGIDEEQLYFLHILMFFCLCHKSPPVSEDENKEINSNEMLTAHQGRNPDLMLKRNGVDISIKNWGTEMIDAMQGIAELLDEMHDTERYSRTLKIQQFSFDEPDSTPSARMLDEMRREGEGFYQYAMRMSHQHHEMFMKDKLSKAQLQQFMALSRSSLLEQQSLEQDTLPFAAFLEKYFSKTL